MEPPPIRYAPTRLGAVAWQESGSPERPTLLMMPPLAQHIEMAWEKPAFWRPLLHLASRVRLIWFDKLGTGVSDPIEEPAGLEGRMEQALAVLDAANVETAAVYGLSDGGTTAIALAALHPERVSALVLANTPSGASASARVKEYGPTLTYEEAIGFWKELAARWGTPDTWSVPKLAPSLASDPAMCAWIPRYERAAASPKLIWRWLEEAFTLDPSPLLDGIEVPTLVMHLRGDKAIPVASGRHLGDRIRGAEYHEFDGNDHFLWVSPDVDTHTATVHSFLKRLGLASEPPPRAPMSGRLWDPYSTLTPAQRKCVRLAQRGLSNAGIAATLDISVRTVENHLARAYPKLGVTSRVELMLLEEEPG